MWGYEFYRDEEGTEPVKDFLLSLDTKRRGKLLQTIQILSEFGYALPFPYSSQVDGKIRELRTHYGRTLYRILYYCNPKGVFVLLHAFEKRAKKIPENQLRIARDRMKNDQNKKEVGDG
jgi:phage-related protein